MKKITLKSIGTEYLYVSDELERILVFGYIYYLIDSLNEKAMKIL